jgi:hypothetical protein
VIDPRNPREKMRGNPLSRVASPDGRWAYTLYDGGGGTPFVHALDTQNGTARCIDLEGLDVAQLFRLRLRLADRGRSVDVVDGSMRVLSIDTHALAVRTFHAGLPWRAGSLGVLVALLATAGIALALRRPRPAPVEPAPD